MQIGQTVHLYFRCIQGCKEVKFCLFQAALVNKYFSCFTEMKAEIIIAVTLLKRGTVLYILANHQPATVTGKLSFNGT